MSQKRKIHTLLDAQGDHSTNSCAPIVDLFIVQQLLSVLSTATPHREMPCGLKYQAAAVEFTHEKVVCVVHLHTRI